MLYIWKHSAQSLCRLLAVLSVIFALQPAHAGLFDDEEARKAILDLRARVDQNAKASDAQNADLKRSLDKSLQDANAANEANAALLRRSLLDLQNQIEALRAEVSRLKGQDEQLSREVAEMQRRQKRFGAGRG